MTTFKHIGQFSQIGQLHVGNTSTMWLTIVQVN
jgi:hypothetical protein